MKRCIDCKYCEKLGRSDWFVCDNFDNYDILGNDRVKKAYRKGQVYRFNKCKYFVRKEQK